MVTGSSYELYATADRKVAKPSNSEIRSFIDMTDHSSHLILKFTSDYILV